MNLIIKDIDLLKKIHPEVVANYLEKRGWQKEKQIENEAIIWSNELSNLILVLPLNPEVSDFPVTINLLVENLAKFEERNELEIMQNLITNLPNVEIQGLVVGLRSLERYKLSGEVDLMGVVVNKLERIKLELFDRDYVTAIRASQERFPVLCKGDLVKQNNVFVLKNY
ncbi:MAG: hypothetical protein F6K22_23555 [Okeania sp. SIO2F4]|uniref:hypothetical protein n=1 Tax=Okeania sp. SIO2F4 TaxID=2607790 RepID=UPI00142AEBC1|nr:hypothetical protein [Okeania sp. SIO2F4]MDJ0515112.1 hypothetical protein [Trichodesmium sp. MO_231.B1]NES05526.1 hypothetical protein [Okeania sp. SIO2F4]